MQSQKQNGLEIYHVFLQAGAYLFAGIFFITIRDVNLPKSGLQIIGYIFLALAFLLVLSPLHSALEMLARKFDKVFLGGLFFATLALLVKTWVDTAGNSNLFIVVLIFILLLIAVFFYDAFRQMRAIKQQVATMVFSILVLKTISVTISMFALVIILFRTDIMGNPLIWLAVGLLSLSVASLLERH